jgi:hypothetical protein
LSCRLARLGNILELIYPSLRRELRTELSAVEAEHALACEVEHPRWRELFGRRLGTFEGTIGLGSFDIQRSTAYENSVLPRIRGTIRAEPYGASVSIEMSLSPVLLTLLALFICSFALPLFAASSPFKARLGSIFGIGFVWAMTMLGFHAEAAMAQRALLRILGATASQP